MKLLVVKSIFIPNENYIQSNINSINSFIKYLSGLNKLYKITIKLVGWINQNIDKSIIEKFYIFIKLLKKECSINSHNIYIESEIWGKNHGKIYLLSNLKFIYPLYKSCNYIIYADHDILHSDDLLSTRIAMECIVSNHKVSLISFDQECDNRHNPRIYENKINIMNIPFYYPINNSDVASGCFITIPVYFDLFSKLKSVNVYGDEDILIGKLLNDNNLISIVSSKKVIHPFDTDDKYIKWKNILVFDIVRNRKIYSSNYWS